MGSGGRAAANRRHDLRHRRGHLHPGCYRRPPRAARQLRPRLPAGKAAERGYQRYRTRKVIEMRLAVCTLAKWGGGLAGGGHIRIWRGSRVFCKWGDKKSSNEIAAMNRPRRSCTWQISAASISAASWTLYILCGRDLVLRIHPPPNPLPLPREPANPTTV